MKDIFGMFFEYYMYFNIIKIFLVVRIFGGIVRNIGYDFKLILDVYQMIIDLDFDKIFNFIFEWRC